jgi:hypothetical protein
MFEHDVALVVGHREREVRSRWYQLEEKRLHLVDPSGRRLGGKPLKSDRPTIG